jgi:enamine deaminase RidA (YjgF/YER057c/UK114 family)
MDMRYLDKAIFLGLIFAILSFGTMVEVAAQDISRLAGGNPKSPIAEAVTVPPGYTTYYISGTPPRAADPTAPLGSPQRMGDTHQQTASSLARIKDILTRLGLTFADVVKATVFMVGDPAKGGEIDFAEMNQAWSDQFGTPQQPNKPARSTIKVAGLAGQGALVEIEMIAAKRN